MVETIHGHKQLLHPPGLDAFDPVQSFPTLFLDLPSSVREEMFGNEYGNVGEAVFSAARTREGIVPP